MLKTTIDFKTAVTILAGVVKEFGTDHVAGGDGKVCSYFDFNSATNGVDLLNLKTSCIVGQVFGRLGIARALVRDATSTEGVDQYSACVAASDLWDNAETMGVYFDTSARRVLLSAQRQQDRGREWGHAVTEAVSEAQENALANFHASAPEFSVKVDALLADASPKAPEPLADWERELLEGPIEG
jgi:hypothetical protein